MAEGFDPIAHAQKIIEGLEVQRMYTLILDFKGQIGVPLQGTGGEIQKEVAALSLKYGSLVGVSGQI